MGCRSEQATRPMTVEGAPIIVTLYARPGCHLCDEARERLEAMRSQGAGFELREIDIESDHGLHRRMLELIPVVEVNGERVSELMLDEGAVLARTGTLSP